MSSRRRSGLSSCTLTLVLLVGAWEADHVLNFVTVGGGGALGLACFPSLDSVFCRAASFREHPSHRKGFQQVGGSVYISSSWKSCSRAEITCAEVYELGGERRSGLSGSGSLPVLSCCLGRPRNRRTSARRRWRRQGGRCVFWERAAPTNLIARRSGRQTGDRKVGEIRRNERERERETINDPKLTKGLIFYMLLGSR